MKTLSAAMLECNNVEAYLDAAMRLRASSEQSREAFLQAIVPRLETALLSLETLHATIEGLGNELRSHASARFVLVK